MAKKTTKTTTKTVTKSSKKGLIIGISITAVIAVAAAITIPLLLLKKPKEPTASLVMDTTEGDYGDFSYDGKKGEGNEINIAKFIGKKDFTIYFIPINEYKDYKFTINIVGASFTATYSETDKKVNIKGERELENKTKLVATFTPEKPEPPVGETWTLKLDSDSTKYGDLEFNGQTADSVIIDKFIGLKDAAMTFVPNGDYKETKFTITAEDAKGDKVTVDNYGPGDKASFHIHKDGGFAVDDVITLHFEEAKEATVALDDDSEKYGELATTDISEYVDSKEFDVAFIPEKSPVDYDKDFKVTIKGADDFIATYSKVNHKISFKSNNPLKNNASLSLKLEFASVSLDKTTFETYGTFKGGAQQVSVAENIGKERFEIDFLPKEGFETIKFNPTLNTTDYTATYGSESKKIVIEAVVTPGVLTNETELVLTLDLPVVKHNVELSIDNGFGYFLDGDQHKPKVSFDAAENLTIAQALAAEGIVPTFSVALTGEEQGKTLTGGEIDYYIDSTTKAKIPLDTPITEDIEATAHVKYNGFGLENTSDAAVQVTLAGSSLDEHPNVYYTVVQDAKEPTVTELNTWTNLYDTSAYKSVSVSPDSIIYFKGDNENGFEFGSSSGSYAWAFALDGDPADDTKIIGHGNIMSLVDNGACNTTDVPTPDDEDAGCFNGIFSNFAQLDLSDDFVLPATNLTHFCYKEMFSNCTSLTRLPKFPETPFHNIPEGSFLGMFAGCNSLKNISKNDLPIIDNDDGNIESKGFENLFYRCDSLENVDLSNITSVSNFGVDCFKLMFWNSSSKLAYVKVGFGNGTDWPKAGSPKVPVTDNWLFGCKSGGIFVWNGETDHDALQAAGLFNYSCIPTNWTVQNPQL